MARRRSITEGRIAATTSEVDIEENCTGPATGFSYRRGKESHAPRLDKQLCDRRTVRPRGCATVRPRGCATVGLSDIFEEALFEHLAGSAGQATVFFP
jgi:hypothetical protein